MIEEPTVIVTMTRKRAELLQQGLADAACWMSGFSAGSGESVIGHNEVREMNISLKIAINTADFETGK